MNTNISLLAFFSCEEQQKKCSNMPFNP